MTILYSFRRCPYAMRARAAVLASGVCCEVREIVLRDKPAALLTASPKGTVPVLVTADGVIDESLDIMRWALERNDPDGWLSRDDGGLIARNDGAFKHHLDRYKYPERHDGDAVAHRGAGLTILADLDARLAGAANLCDASVGLADMAILPFVRQFAAVDRAWFDVQPLSHLRAWLDRYVASPLFERVMTKRAVWREGDMPVMLA